MKTARSAPRSQTGTREEAEHWYRTMPRTPAMVRTTSGVHFWHRLKDGDSVKSCVRIAGVMRDVRAEPSYSMAPPSLHPSGKHCEWVHQNCQLIVVPEFGLGWIEAECSEICKQVRDTFTPEGEMARRVRAYQQTVEPASTGAGRHNLAFYAAECSRLQIRPEPRCGLAAVP